MSRRTMATMLLIAVGLAFGVEVWPRLTGNGLVHTDEVLAGERAREMHVRGDPGRITLNFQPDYHKPPLQYWISSSLLARFERPELAVRLPSFLFALGSVLLTGLAAGRFLPGQPFVMPLAGLLFAADLAVRLYAGIGILEPGQVFFLMLAVLGLPCGSQPARWPLAAFACTCGALQKLPVGFAMWLVFVIADALRTRSPSMLRDSWRPMLIAALVAGAWPALQIARDASAYLAIHQGELAKLAGRPDNPFSAWWQYMNLLRMSSPLLLAAGATGWLTLCVSRTARTIRGLPEVAAYALLWLAAISLSHVKHPHYLLSALPLLALVAVVPVASALATRPGYWRFGIGSAMSLVALAYAATHPLPGGFELRDQRTVTRSLAARLAPEETPVLIVPSNPATPYPLTVTAEYLLFYSGSTRPVRRLTAEHTATLLGDDVLSQGIADAEAFRRMTSLSPRFRAVEQTKHFVHWQEVP